MNDEKTITILYVDDEEPNRFIFEANFKRKYNILVASSGREGLEILKSKAADIDIVISDQRMPLMNGVEFITTAKKSFNHIPYFILTAFSFNDEIESAFKNQIIHGYFSKPLNVAKVEDAINQAMRNSN